MKNSRILIIDDEKVLTETLVTLLKIHNFDTSVAYNGVQAIAQLESGQFDLIICDINLPDITGYEILKFAKAHTKTFNIPFVFLTAYSDERDIKYGMDLGADDYLVKPFAGADLIAKIRGHILTGKQAGISAMEIWENSWSATITTNFEQNYFQPIRQMIDNELAIVGVESGAPVTAKENALISKKLLKDTERLALFSLLITNHVPAMFSNICHTSLDGLVREVLGQRLDATEMNKVAYFDIEPVISWRGSEDHMRIIFGELIDNALQYMLPETRIFIRLQPTPNGFVFSVSNVLSSEVNITVSDIAPFYKPAMQNAGTAMGLGLYICLALVNLYNYKFLIKKEEPYITFEIVE